MSAISFFTDSIDNQCKYTAFPCKSQADFDNGECVTCHSPNGCNRMGYYSSTSRDQGDMYLNTQSPVSTPYCKQNYKVSLVSTSSLTQARGKFTIFFQTKNHISTTGFKSFYLILFNALNLNSLNLEILDDSATTFKKGSEDTRFISLNNPLDDGELLNVFISFTKSTSLLSSWLYENKWAFDRVEVFSGN